MRRGEFRISFVYDGLIDFTDAICLNDEAINFLVGVHDNFIHLHIAGTAVNRRDFASGTFWLAISVFLIPMALELGVGAFSKPKAGFLLFWSSLCLAAMSMVLMGKSVIRRHQKTCLSEPWKGVKWRNAVIAIVLLFLYASFLTSLGFLVTMFLFLVSLYYLGRVSLPVSIAGAAVTVFLAYVIFHFALQVPFPQGIVAW